MGLCFEDLPVGMRFESKPIAVSAEEIVRFAADFDPQPFHLDDAAARQTFFGGLAGSGWHTTALTMRLIVATLPIEGGVIGAGADELRWPNALRPGDRIRVRGEVIEARELKSRKDRGLVRFRIETLNQDDQAVQVMVPNLFVPLRAAPPRAPK
ncbi:MAG TPA: MaoC family dehydratase [Usitatibacter sp.]|nr:MaoC family dehydratase [Usitatibacter sp.]